MQLAFTFIDLDGLDDIFEGTMSGLGLVAIVLAVFIGIAVVQVAVDRVRGRVKVQR